MHAEEFFRQALVYLTAAVVSVPVAKRLGLGSVLGYLVAGVIVGPFGLGLVGEERQDVMHFAEFGVVMMLFLVGLELDPAMLWRLRGPILGLGGLQVALTALAGAGIALGLGLSAPVALAVGLILAMSSTAIALQSLDEKGLLKTPGGQNAFAVLLFQDVAVIPILALLPLLASAAGAAAVTSAADTAGAHEAAGAGAAGGAAGLSGWMQTLAVLGAVALIVVAGRFLVRPALRAIARTRLSELFTAAALLIVIAIATLMTKAGVSPALGTFLAGVILAGSEYRHELVSDIEPFKGLLLGLFFIAVGASIDFGLLAARPVAIAALVLAAIVVKLVVLVGLGRGFRLAAPDNAVFSLALAQVGEFAFVLIAFAGTIGLFPAEVSGPFVAVVALSMAASPLLLALAEKVIVPRLRRSPRVDPRTRRDPRGEPGDRRRLRALRADRRAPAARPRRRDHGAGDRCRPDRPAAALLARGPLRRRVAHRPAARRGGRQGPAAGAGDRQPREADRDGARRPPPLPAAPHPGPGGGHARRLRADGRRRDRHLPRDARQLAAARGRCAAAARAYGATRLGARRGRSCATTRSRSGSWQRGAATRRSTSRRPASGSPTSSG